MPVPLVQRDGRWAWDGAAGADELIYRRVGANELGAIDVSRGYVQAQFDYAAEGRDGDPAGIYALKLLSDEGLHNGLYWPTAEGEAPSPAGPFVAAAAGEGYRRSADRQPYHGYYYRMLYAQGPNANGGAREYFKDGLLTEGFALIAWPADYGSSGVQTFIVNHDGVVFQKDLGEDTAKVVETIKLFDPDASWTAIVPPARRGGAVPPVGPTRGSGGGRLTSGRPGCRNAQVPEGPSIVILREQVARFTGQRDPARRGQREDRHGPAGRPARRRLPQLGQALPGRAAGASRCACTS